MRSWSRNPARDGEVGWDGRTLGPWTAAIDGSDVVINLAGRSVSCRYTAANLSWIHDRDFVRAVEFLVERDDLTGPVNLTGPMNLAAPAPLPQRTFMRALRSAWGVPVGLPATKWMAELGAFALRSYVELLLKSRRVVPGRLLEAGFTFDYDRGRQPPMTAYDGCAADDPPLKRQHGHRNERTGFP